MVVVFLLIPSIDTSRSLLLFATFTSIFMHLSIRVHKRLSTNYQILELSDEVTYFAGFLEIVAEPWSDKFVTSYSFVSCFNFK